MSAPIKAPPRAATSVVVGSDVAPVVYFDGICAWGLFQGAVQIEIGMNVPYPASDNTTKTKVQITGHLRGTIAAMMQLKQAIDEALATLQRKQDERAN